MAKPKFELTSELVKIEPEPIQAPIQPMPQQLVVQEQPVLDVKKSVEEKDGISLKISKALKKELQIWCIHNNMNMTETLEAALREYLDQHG